MLIGYGIAHCLLTYISITKSEWSEDYLSLEHDNESQEAPDEGIDWSIVIEIHKFIQTTTNLKSL